MEQIYYNLTQCLQIKNFNEARWVYFRSSWIETMNYKGLLWSVPDEILAYLSQGETVTIIDASIKKRGKVERIFIPVLKCLLERIWINKTNTIYCNEHLKKALSVLKEDNSLNTKFRFWKHRLKLTVPHIKLKAATIRISNEIQY